MDEEPAADPRPRRLREALGISLEGAAEALGLWPGSLSRFETGERHWPMHVTLPWLKYMTVKVAEARRTGQKIPERAVPTLEDFAQWSATWFRLRVAGGSPNTTSPSAVRENGGEKQSRRKVASGVSGGTH